MIAKTHHAVNNALNKIRKMCAKAPISKIGSKLKSDNVDKSICIYEKYSKYQAAYKKRPAYRGRNADVVGMTLQSAIINLGLLNTSFRPSIIFVDEASQLTLAEASVLGVFGASSIVFSVMTSRCRLSSTKSNKVTSCRYPSFHTSYIYTPPSKANSVSPIA